MKAIENFQSLDSYKLSRKTLMQVSKLTTNCWQLWSNTSQHVFKLSSFLVSPHALRRTRHWSIS